MIKWPSGTSLAVDFGRLVDAAQPEVVVDVGANTGQFAAALRLRGYEGRIVSFEPLSAPFALLARHARGDPLWEAHQTALGGVRGQTEMHVPSETSIASMMKLSARGREHFSSYLRVAANETVRVETLDGIWDDLVRAERALLKIDVQGAEAAVLDGATRSLEKVVGAQIEMSVVGYYDGAMSYLDLLHRLRGVGFEPAAFNPVSLHEGVLGEVDVIVVRPGVAKNLAFR